MKKKTPRPIITKTQAKVLALLKQGLSTQQIAEDLGKSHYTIRKHIENMLTKTGAKTRLELYIKVSEAQINDDEKG
ncbi:MAG: helix-turn-helix transcriptional regulator [Betaproteobacteria bacterium]|nr:helix-turn-helix transcriptional regulator [Betaproteobacteria bacterium]